MLDIKGIRNISVNGTTGNIYDEDGHLMGKLKDLSHMEQLLKEINEIASAKGNSVIQVGEIYFVALVPK